MSVQTSIYSPSVRPSICNMYELLLTNCYSTKNLRNYAFACLFKMIYVVKYKRLDCRISDRIISTSGMTQPYSRIKLLFWVRSKVREKIVLFQLPYLSSIQNNQAFFFMAKKGLLIKDITVHASKGVCIKKRKWRKKRKLGQTYTGVCLQVISFLC